MKRYKMSRSHSRKSFSRSGSRTHKRNLGSSGSMYSMRGGIRL